MAGDWSLIDEDKEASIYAYYGFSEVGGDLLLESKFIRAFQDWELESVDLCCDMLYLNAPIIDGMLG